MTDKQPEALIRADELEQIGAKSSLARAMAAHTIKLLYKENEALRARLAQPEPEPVSMDSDKVICPSCCHQFRAIPVNVQQLMIDAGFNPPFTAPPQREWQGLTDEEVKAAWSQLWYDLGNGKFAASDDPARHTTIMFAKEIEAKLKAKNA